MQILSRQNHNFLEQTDVLQSMSDFVAESASLYLKSVEESWQPTTFLPDLSRETWVEDLQQFRALAQQIPDDLLVVLIGDMVTEEALPSYQTWLNGLKGVADPGGASRTPWAQWTRGWTAEENRHGDLLNKYLYLTGRVDMMAVEKTIQHLIRNGFDPLTENDPYQGFIYTSFQERATKISHRNVAILAAKTGDSKLQAICGQIAGDEARHERAYQAFISKVFELDTNNAMIAFAKMMKKKIIMPARLMGESENDSIFSQFTMVAQRIGVYTSKDYTEIISHLIQIWNVENLSGLSAEAAEAQEYVCSLPERYTRLAERVKISNTPQKFRWIYNREA